MGWAGGSRLAIDLWSAVTPHIQSPHTRNVAREIWAAFEGHDCDTLDEAEELAKACGYDYDEDWDGEGTECSKWSCTNVAAFVGTVQGMNVRVCKEHKQEVESLDEIPK